MTKNFPIVWSRNWFINNLHVFFLWASREEYKISKSSPTYMNLDLAQLEERVTVEIAHMEIIRSVVRIRQSRDSFFIFLWQIR